MGMNSEVISNQKETSGLLAWPGFKPMQVKGTLWIKKINTSAVPREHTAKYIIQVMMISLDGNIVHITGHLLRESTNHRWIPLTKANDVELWCFLWCVSEEVVE